MWYNYKCMGLIKPYKKGMLEMILNDEKFNFDIENLRKDLAIENMVVTDADVALLKRYHDKEISMNDVIDSIKQSI